MCVNLTVYSLMLHNHFAPQFIKQGRQDEGLHARQPGQIGSVSYELVLKSPEDNFALPLATINPYFDFFFDRFDFVYGLCWDENARSSYGLSGRPPWCDLKPSTIASIFTLGVAAEQQQDSTGSKMFKRWGKKNQGQK